MTALTRRVQAVLSEEQFTELSRLAAAQGKPVSRLIREAIDHTYFEQGKRERRRAALASLLSLNAPVADWDIMEQEIARGALE